jgi:hypothetical protein
MTQIFQKQILTWYRLTISRNQSLVDHDEVHTMYTGHLHGSFTLTNNISVALQKTNTYIKNPPNFRVVRKSNTGYN